MKQLELARNEIKQHRESTDFKLDELKTLIGNIGRASGAETRGTQAGEAEDGGEKVCHF